MSDTTNVTNVDDYRAGRRAVSYRVIWVLYHRHLRCTKRAETIGVRLLRTDI